MSADALQMFSEATPIRTDLSRLLSVLYGEEEVPKLADRILDRLDRVSVRPARSSMWSQSDVVLIAYADAIQTAGEPPLTTLRRFLRDRLDGLIAQVHVLPFFPYTSDDGFAVSDYLAVDPIHGDWADVTALSNDVELVFDLVINHASSSHPRFQEFLRDEAPGNRYFVTADTDADVAGVTRPRAHPLLQAFETASGTRNVWCTFSRDQVDWDFSNPDVLFEFVDVFLSYVEYGASWMRIDAIAYLWKSLGTSCVHLPQTHAVVKLLRVIAEAVAPDFKLLTETNVPLEENLSYFGDGDEAHIVYNFSLPPLLTHALVTGQSDYLTRWCQSLPELPKGCTFLNFVASHDGIGLRPAEGILPPTELNRLVDCVTDFGGCLTQRRQADGSLSPYEANISLFDLFRGTVDGEDQWQVERFLVSQGVMMAFAGVPALYYNTVLAAPNDVEGFQKTGRNRSLNRKKWTVEEVGRRLDESDGVGARVLRSLKTMLQVRKARSEFHPESDQACVSVSERAFALLRTEPTSGRSILCVFNLSNVSIQVAVDRLPVSETASLNPVFKQGEVVRVAETMRMSPYAMAWFAVT